MKPERISLKLAVLFLTGVVGAPFALAEDTWHASKSEAAQLPLFCWGQLMSDEFRGPEYEILDCGPFMNHYCLGLLKIVRANKTIGDIALKKQMLRGARVDTETTLRDMKPYPTCSIREHAEKTLQQIDSLQRAFGK
jgi:hypothetical protein